MSDSYSIIDRGVIFEGTISSIGNMVIKGTLRGTLVGENVVIGEEGKVYAELKARNITVGGTFEGKIIAGESLEILSSGILDGKVTCKDLKVEPGGVFNAEVTCTALQNHPSNMLSGGETKEK